MSASAWAPGEIVDGAGLPLEAHAERIAAKLDLPSEAAVVLVSELRNALVPVRYLVETRRAGEEQRDALRGVERVLALATAIAKRAGAVG